MGDLVLLQRPEPPVPIQTALAVVPDYQLDSLMLTARNGEKWLYVYHGEDVWIFSRFGMVKI